MVSSIYNLKAVLKIGTLLLLVVSIGCRGTGKAKDEVPAEDPTARNNFKEDVDFIKMHTELIVLESNNGISKIAISPELQARVMTSTANGWNGASYGWINKERFGSGDTLEHINAYGGEERFWLGPEGGQFSIFFKQGDEFNLDNWYTPRLIDLEPFDIISRNDRAIQFKKEASLVNYSGFTFDLEISRKISILSDQQIDSVLTITIGDAVKTVGYSTENILTNSGNSPWTKDSGLLSIWILGMYKHSPNTTVIIPYNRAARTGQNSVVNDDYFGKIPSDRLKIGEKAIFFKADGKERGKIGLGPDHAMDILGSYDPNSNTLTIVKYNKPTGPADYVNSKWEIQADPFGGDVVNAYNDGPPEPGADPLGPFYELETSSPGAILNSDESLTHIQYTFHFEGTPEALNVISRRLLHVSIPEILNAFE